MSSTKVVDAMKDVALIDEERREQAERNQDAIALLRSWVDVDEREAEEQRETLAFLMQALNEDRLSDRDR
jgi:hypothetical protein